METLTPQEFKQIQEEKLNKDFQDDCLSQEEEVLGEK